MTQASYDAQLPSYDGSNVAVTKRSVLLHVGSIAPLTENAYTRRTFNSRAVRALMRAPRPLKLT